MCSLASVAQFIQFFLLVPGTCLLHASRHLGSHFISLHSASKDGPIFAHFLFLSVNAIYCWARRAATSHFRHLNRLVSSHSLSFIPTVSITIVHGVLPLCDVASRADNNSLGDVDQAHSSLDIILTSRLRLRFGLRELDYIAANCHHIVWRLISSNVREFALTLWDDVSRQSSLTTCYYRGFCEEH